ncbi:MAG: flagellar hook-length control protein FliK, partial [Clostridium butyricum]
MPGIWNINNGYNMNTRKVSSKLTFEVGEKFTGRIVDKGDGKDVTIKLSDGWQFIAELDGKVNLDDIKLVKFQVDGFENGKLKLKLVKGDTSNNNVDEGDENFQEVVEKEGLSKEDVELLKKMVKHNFS